MDEVREIYIQAFQKLWLPIGLVLVTALSTVLPVPSETVSDLFSDIDGWTSSIIAFMCGLCISTEAIFHCAKTTKIHLIVVGINLIFIPIFTEISTYLLTKNNVIESDDFIEGLIIATCLPPSFRSAVILTLDALGNETCAIISVLLSQYLAIFLTPFLITVLMGTAELTTARESFWSVNKMLLLPLLMGHIIQRLTDFRNEQDIPFGFIMKAILLFNYYVAIVTVTQELEIYSPLQIIVMFLVVSGVMVILKIIISILSSKLQLDPGAWNATAIMFASTHKSVQYGIMTLNDATAVPCGLWLYFIAQIMTGCFMSLFYKYTI